MTRFRSAVFAVGFLTIAAIADAAPPLGTLVHDGPPTPEQISLYLPIVGALPLEARASVRHRPAGGGSWTTAHPLHRIRPEFVADGEPTADAFAGVIFELAPGNGYTVEVTVSWGASTDVQTLTAATRPLPPPAGVANKTIAAGATSAQIQTAFNGLNPGDVLQFAEGTYTLNNIQIDRSGTEAQPVYIRGAGREGVVLRDTTGRVLYLLNASNLIIEDLTLEGAGVDSGTNSSSEGVRLWDGVDQRRVTVRRVTMRGVDKAVAGEHPIEQILVYDCTLTGNNLWTQAFLETNLAWNDDGVRLPGKGNAAFNNTLSGFGDAFAVTAYVENVGVHFYRNDILMTGDDAFEGDYAHRNVSFYDNRVHNSMTLASMDPIYGGPAYVFRNISINTGRGPFKFNATNTGHLIYNNTLVRTNGFGSGQGWGWVQFNNGPQRAWAYVNNVLLYRGTGGLFAMESGGQDPVDFTNNAWFPNDDVWWSSSGGSYNSMAQARAGLPATTPLFGVGTHRHGNDVISESDPFSDDVVLGSSYLTRITDLYTPGLADGSAPRNAGVAIPGITDGFSGPAPDMGAVITGRAATVWGDRGGFPPAPPAIPARPRRLRVR